MLEDEDSVAQRRFYTEEPILILLIILSLVGVRITDYSPIDGYAYWMIMVFVFAFFSIIIGWLQSRQRITDFKKILREQSIHWFTSLLVVEGVSLLQKTDHMTRENAALVIMMDLAQSTILDGLRVGWRFSVVGVFLGVSAIIAAHWQHFFWIELFIAILIVAGTIMVQSWLEKRVKAA